MIHVVNTSAEDPFQKSLSYKKKSTAEVIYQGTIHCKQITYEKQINLCCRIIRVALCVLAAVTLIPLCFSASLISKWWYQAMNGVDQKIVLIKNRKQPPPSKNVPPPDKDGQKPGVRFRDARARLFDKEAPPANVANVASVNLANLEASREAPFSAQQQRKIPPLSIIDTMIAPGVSEHGTTTFFADEEIVEILPIVARELIGNDVYATYTKHGKAIIQQQATRGCTAATAAMLCMDHGVKADLQKLMFRNLGTDERQARDFREAGIHAITNMAFSYRDLRNLITKHGSAIVSGRNDGPLSGHVFIVDDISEDFYNVRIRDPYHGWEITITGAAFENAWQGGKVIQATGKIT